MFRFSIQQIKILVLDRCFESSNLLFELFSFALHLSFLVHNTLCKNTHLFQHGLFLGFLLVVAALVFCGSFVLEHDVV